MPKATKPRAVPKKGLNPTRTDDGRGFRPGIVQDSPRNQSPGRPHMLYGVTDPFHQAVLRRLADAADITDKRKKAITLDKAAEALLRAASAKNPSIKALELLANTLDGKPAPREDNPLPDPTHIAMMRYIEVYRTLDANQLKAIQQASLKLVNAPASRSGADSGLSGDNEDIV